MRKTHSDVETIIVIGRSLGEQMNISKAQNKRKIKKTRSDVETIIIIGRSLRESK